MLDARREMQNCGCAMTAGERMTANTGCRILLSARAGARGGEKGRLPKPADSHGMIGRLLSKPRLRHPLIVKISYRSPDSHIDSLHLSTHTSFSPLAHKGVEFLYFPEFLSGTLPPPDTQFFLGLCSPFRLYVLQNAHTIHRPLPQNRPGFSPPFYHVTKCGSYAI